MRTMRLEAPRGPILDRNGHVARHERRGHGGRDLAGRPAEERAARTTSSARSRRSLGVPAQRSPPGSSTHGGDPLDAGDRPDGIHSDQVEYLEEHAARVPGRPASPRRYLRQLPVPVARRAGARLRRRDLAAAVQGARRARATAPATRSARRASSRPTTSTCAAATGRRSSRSTRAAGRRARSRPWRSRSRANALRLTIDIGLQRAAEQALRVRDPARAQRTASGTRDGGAIVALDPHDGAVLAMASNPTYKPRSTWAAPTRRSSRRCLDPKAAAKANFPGLNRAIDGIYPPGSTLQAGDGARGDAGARRSRRTSSIPCTPTYTALQSRRSRTGTRPSNSR